MKRVRKPAGWDSLRKIGSNISKGLLVQYQGEAGFWKKHHFLLAKGFPVEVEILPKEKQWKTAKKKRNTRTQRLFLLNFSNELSGRNDLYRNIWWKTWDSSGFLVITGRLLTTRRITSKPFTCYWQSRGVQIPIFRHEKSLDPPRGAKRKDGCYFWC